MELRKYIRETIKEIMENDIPEKRNQFGLRVTYRPYKCTNCGHEQEIQTNHTGECMDYCKGCSWMPSQGKGYKIPALGGHTYRKFVYNGDNDENLINDTNLNN